MWEIKTTESYERRFKHYAKKHRRELLAVLSNLDRFKGALDAGSSSQQAKEAFGFTHREPGGVVAIDQKGGGPSLAQTRLYAYALDLDCVLYLITLGDKNTQADDLRTCRASMEAISEAEKKDDGDRQDVQ